MKIIFASCIAAIVLAVTFGCSRERSEYLDGKADAERDLAKGVFMVAHADSNQFPAWYPEYEDLLWKNYGIRCGGYSLPKYPRAAEARAKGYNEISQAAIEGRFGSNVLSRTMAEAKKLYESKASATH
jgi:hypothetical protein